MSFTRTTTSETLQDGDDGYAELTRASGPAASPDASLLSAMRRGSTGYSFFVHSFAALSPDPPSASELPPVPEPTAATTATKSVAPTPAPTPPRPHPPSRSNSFPPDNDSSTLSSPFWSSLLAVSRGYDSSEDEDDEDEDEYDDKWENGWENEKEEQWDDDVWSEADDELLAGEEDAQELGSGMEGLVVYDEPESYADGTDGQHDDDDVNPHTIARPPAPSPAHRAWRDAPNPPNQRTPWASQRANSHEVQKSDVSHNRDYEHERGVRKMRLEEIDVSYVHKLHVSYDHLTEKSLKLLEGSERPFKLGRCDTSQSFFSDPFSHFPPNFCYRPGTSSTSSTSSNTSNSSTITHLSSSSSTSFGNAVFLYTPLTVCAFPELDCTACTEWLRQGEGQGREREETAEARYVGLKDVQPSGTPNQPVPAPSSRYERSDDQQNQAVAGARNGNEGRMLLRQVGEKALMRRHLEEGGG
ncbi:hypothetical protein IAT38_005385 [Cryptococcus sp. DSM 104549]